MDKPVRPIAILMVAGTLLLSACGEGSDAGSGTASPDTTSARIGAPFNDADVLFAQGMIPHHAQAVEMASIALTPEAGARAEIQALASAIQGAQDPEIEMMTEWLQAWGQPMEMDGMDGMHGTEGVDGMMTEEQMASLASLSGADFDTAWATMMIAHHQGAIAQAETVKANGADADVLALAAQIISAQEGEIVQMQAMLAG